MFTHKSATSANRPVDLPAGLYEGVSVLYRMDQDAGEFVLSEFCRVGTRVVSFIELLIVAEDQEGVFYADFLKLPDGLWRDSNGKTAYSLGELMPAATLSAVQVRAVDLGRIEHSGV